MKRLIVCVVALAAACSGPQEQKGPPDLPQASMPMTDGAGNRMEALTQSPDGSQWCSADGAWCVAAGAAPQATSGDRSIALPPDDVAERAVWPFVIRFAGGGETTALVGLASTTHQMYSGGSAEATHVSLFSIPRQGDDARHVLTLPARGAASIRACFDEADELARSGACLDEYQLETRLTLDETTTAGAPRIVLETAAGTYPGPRSRQQDSTQAPPLQPGDLTWAEDETCTFRRVFAAGPDGAYVPDAPLPQCADYLEP